MTLRSFTVFQDAPPTELHKPKTSSHFKEMPPSSSSVTIATSLGALASAAEKENVHPVTGERATIVTSKKRKTTALSTKSQMPLTVKRQKDTSIPKPATKKRKSSSARGKSSQKDGNASGTGRKSSKKNSRKVSPLPVVDETGESEKESQRILLAEIDARCYELTVRPLADVTQAYDQGFEHPPVVEDEHADDSEKNKFRMVKESSCEPDIYDYISPLLTAGSLPFTIDRATTPSSEYITAPSTPEKKKVQPAFTFSSPSRSGERFRAKSAEKGSAPNSPSPSS